MILEKVGGGGEQVIKDLNVKTAMNEFWRES